MTTIKQLETTKRCLTLSECLVLITYALIEIVILKLQVFLQKAIKSQRRRYGRCIKGKRFSLFVVPAATVILKRLIMAYVAVIERENSYLRENQRHDYILVEII